MEADPNQPNVYDTIAEQKKQRRASAELDTQTLPEIPRRSSSAGLVVNQAMHAACAESVDDDNDYVNRGASDGLVVIANPPKHHLYANAESLTYSALDTRHEPYGSVASAGTMHRGTRKQSVYDGFTQADISEDEDDDMEV